MEANEGEENQSQSRSHLGLLCIMMAPLKETAALWFLVATNIFLAITATLSNIAILAALYKESSLRPPSKILLSSLALTDLCVGLLLDPLFVVFLMTIEYGSGTNLCHYVITITYVTGLFLSSVSMSTMAAISVDRLLALLLGLRYRQIVTFRRVLVNVISFWTLSMVFASAVIWDFDVTLRYGSIGTAFVVAVSTCCYTKIYQQLRQRRVQIHAPQTVQSNGEAPLNIARYRKTLSSALWVQFALVVCCLPMGVVLALIAVKGVTPYLAFAWTFSVTLVHFNSTLNPILYCWKIREVRRAIIETIRQISCLTT